jgi:hypothetical protein
LKKTVSAYSDTSGWPAVGWPAVARTSWII